MLAAAASPRLSFCRSRRHVTPTRERGRGEEAGPREGTPPHVTGSLHGGPAPAGRELHAPEFPTPVTTRAAGAVGAARGLLAGMPRPQLNHRAGKSQQVTRQGKAVKGSWASVCWDEEAESKHDRPGAAEQISPGWRREAPGIGPLRPVWCFRSIHCNPGGG